ncbi:pilus assembly PilX family protein [Pseudoduganella umbonata]|uniref:Pilus assembly protein PilX n=1 Tax=Pseudoduganella umbonata TaxID=864828 RepID=A0A4P8HZK8_9BURK|nr:PilX N-terminal domain-containing pilus assembly protein [Pseudoduganella umbonata]MBB3224135.1 type IV pilus assembly protein PilX [Pseudoduganella umbonata]QCP14004.1 pilus assembly protein PilX [Pseudoduganella umbonata]
MRRTQRGVALVVTLVMLVAVLMLAATAAGMALMGEKAARAERDRHVALQAAEDALMDAERDIEEAAPDRAALLAAPGDFAPGCGTGAALGLCGPAGPGDPPPWQVVDLAADGAHGAHGADGATVALGHFTGAAMQTGEGALPMRRPRYIIERRPYHRAGDEAGAAARYYYRVTAIGFGNREGVQVVLQSAWRRPGD